MLKNLRPKNFFEFLKQVYVEFEILNTGQLEVEKHAGAIHFDLGNYPEENKSYWSKTVRFGFENSGILAMNGFHHISIVSSVKTSTFFLNFSL